MGQPRDWRVFALVQRIEPQHRMIRLLLRMEREKLSANRVGKRRAPIDEREKIRRNAERHRRMGDAGFEVGENGFRNECSKSCAQLCDAGDGVALLPFMIAKFGDAGLRVSRDVSPEFIAAKVAEAGALGGSTCSGSRTGFVVCIGIRWWRDRTRVRCGRTRRRKSFLRSC